MGLTQEKPYRRYNKTTGLFEWVRPEPTEYVKGSKIKPIKINKEKKKWR